MLNWDKNVVCGDSYSTTPPTIQPFNSCDPPIAFNWTSLTIRIKFQAYLYLTIDPIDRSMGSGFRTHNRRISIAGRFIADKWWW